MSKLLLVAVALCGLFATALPAGAVEPGDTDEAGRLIVGVDDAGDHSLGDGQAGAALGQDLTSAAIGLSEDGTTLEFVIGLASLPPNGGIPEFTRYTWDFNVDGEPAQLDGKWTNYSRGACDPTSGQCPPPRNPGMQPFFLRGNCGVLEGSNVTVCEELANIQAAFDPAAATITIPVPAELLNLGPCSVISEGVGLFGGSVEAQPSAFFTTTSFPHDIMFVDEDFVVPPATADEVCPE